MSEIESIKAKIILDSRKKETIEVILKSKEYSGKASVPSGKSTGRYEAKTVPPENAVKNIEKINNILVGKKFSQKSLDTLLKKLKLKIGANTTLAVSLAFARLEANEKKLPLYRYLGSLVGNKKFAIPFIYANIINGGLHAKNHLPIQEFMVSPRENSVQGSINAIKKIQKRLKSKLKKLHKKITYGDEGGFSPKLSIEEALYLVQESLGKKIAIDCAASNFYKNGFYHLEKKYSKEELLEYYLRLIKKYEISSIEDPFSEDDFSSFKKITALSKIQVVGDDLTTTNTQRIKKAIKEKLCNCVLIKPNQIGTLTETLDAVQLAKKHGLNIMIGNRSGETMDSFISDLAVGVNAQQIKIGVPLQKERLIKYKKLMELERCLKKG